MSRCAIGDLASRTMRGVADSVLFHGPLLPTKSQRACVSIGFRREGHEAPSESQNIYSGTSANDSR